MGVNKPWFHPIQAYFKHIMLDFVILLEQY
jgi:hypothetical protein